MSEQTLENFMEHMAEYRAERAQFAKSMSLILEPRKQWDRFRGLRDFYSKLDMSEYTARPYGISWTDVLTPIEEDVWFDIRSHNLPMWPQLPVGRYFLDFGDPFERIGLECDGKQWHDAERDAQRDAELAGMGWLIFRIPGFECQKSISEDWIEKLQDLEADMEEVPEEAIQEWLETTSEGFVAALASVFYGRTEYVQFSDDDAIRALARRASNEDINPWIPFIWEGRPRSRKVLA